MSSRPFGATIARAVLAPVDALAVNRSKANARRHVDDFYDLPSPLPEGLPGTVIKVEPCSAFLDPLRLLRIPADTWRVMYLSTGVNGRRTAVTGLLMVPRWGYRSAPRPLISYAYGGYAVVSPRTAPSVQAQAGLPGELGLAASYLLRGWAVMVTDYDRFGELGFTLTLSDAAGHAVIDAARAAQQVADADLDPAGPVAFLGYSLGGHAAAAAVERQPAYAPELNVAGAAFGGGPSDLRVTAQRVENGPLFGFMLGVVGAMLACYPELPTDQLTPKALAAVAEIPDLRAEALVVRYGFRNATEFVGNSVSEFFDNQPLWRRRAEEQKLGQLTPTAPIFLYHARFDPFNPVVDAARLYRDWTERGADIVFTTYPAEHLVTLPMAQPYVHRFLTRCFHQAAVAATARPTPAPPVSATG